MNNPIKMLSKKELALWEMSILIVLASNFMSVNFDLLTLAAALIGVTALIFAAKGNVWAQILSIRQSVILILAGIFVTAIFYYVLKMLNTPNIVFSTISVTTSFAAVSLTMLRSSYYAVGYAANDLVLIILWVLASVENPAYIPVVVNFRIFFFNDVYGFISWKKRELEQA